MAPDPALTYLEIKEGCSLTVSESCATAHSRPDDTSPVRASLRRGTVLLVAGSTTTSDGTLWYEIAFAEGLRYPERLKLPWFVRSDAGEIVRTAGPSELSTTTPTSTKSLLVDRSDQRLYAYEGETLVKTYIISTGRELTPTPRGTFHIYRKTPTRYMQGPIPGITEKYYDLPGVPWNLYFTAQGAIVHGAYWHNSFGSPYSNGCVNLSLTDARAVYDWADLGMTITVRD
jgi:lipoprotein-anchoring transpeptidase ErfK/SrfK